MPQKLTDQKIKNFVKETHPGLEGQFTRAMLTKGVTAQDSDEDVRRKVQDNLLGKLSKTKKIIWTQAPQTKLHYGYGRDNIRYVLTHENSRTKYTALKQIMTEEEFEEYPYLINFWNHCSAGAKPDMDDLLASNAHDLAGAKKLCAQDYTAVCDPEKLAWVHKGEILYAEGLGKNQYMIEEGRLPNDPEEAEELQGANFNVEKSNYSRANPSDRSLGNSGECTLFEAMQLAQKDHTKALARKLKREKTSR